MTRKKKPETRRTNRNPLEAGNAKKPTSPMVHPQLRTKNLLPRRQSPLPKLLLSLLLRLPTSLHRRHLPNRHPRRPPSPHPEMLPNQHHGLGRQSLRHEQDPRNPPLRLRGKSQWQSAKRLPKRPKLKRRLQQLESLVLSLSSGHRHFRNPFHRHCNTHLPRLRRSPRPSSTTLRFWPPRIYEDPISQRPQNICRAIVFAFLSLFYISSSVGVYYVCMYVCIMPVAHRMYCFYHSISFCFELNTCTILFFRPPALFSLLPLLPPSPIALSTSYVPSHILSSSLARRVLCDVL